MSKPRIVCFGEGMVEERIAPDGTLMTHYGGDTLNTAIHLARLGCDVAYATAVGADAESDALVAAWEAEGLDCSLVMRHAQRKTGRYRIAVDAHGERSFSYDRSHSAAREFFAIDGALDALGAIEDADCLLFSLISLAVLPPPSREILLDQVAIAQMFGEVVYDGNFRPALWENAEAARDWHHYAIQMSDIGLPTLEDEQAIRGGDEVDGADEVAAHWTWLGCEEVVVKVGAEGCRLPGGAMLPPPARLDPVDTSGAGDAFNAGYLAARLRGGSCEDAALAGHRLAGWVIGLPGAVPPSPPGGYAFPVPS